MVFAAFLIYLMSQTVTFKMDLLAPQGLVSLDVCVCPMWDEPLVHRSETGLDCFHIQIFFAYVRYFLQPLVFSPAESEHT